MALLLQCLRELRIRQGEPVGFALDLNLRQSAWVAGVAGAAEINAAERTSKLSFDEAAARNAAAGQLRHQKPIRQ